MTDTLTFTDTHRAEECLLDLLPTQGSTLAAEPEDMHPDDFAAFLDAQCDAATEAAVALLTDEATAVLGSLLALLYTANCEPDGDKHTAFQAPGHLYGDVHTATRNYFAHVLGDDLGEQTYEECLNSGHVDGSGVHTAAAHTARKIAAWSL
jgi:hypothetical protein